MAPKTLQQARAEMQARAEAAAAQHVGRFMSFTLLWGLSFACCYAVRKWTDTECCRFGLWPVCGRGALQC